MKVLRMIGTGLLVLLLVAIVLMTYRLVSEGSNSRFMSPQPGVANDQLMACPESVNYVNSCETDELHSTIAIEGDARTLEKLAGYSDPGANLKRVEALKSTVAGF